MGKTGGVQNQTFPLQGRSVSPADLAWLRNWIADQPHYSRKRLARKLCQLWHWRDTRGRLKDFAARSFLLKLAAQGVVSLPPLQLQQRRIRPPVQPPPDWHEPTPWSAPLPAVCPSSGEALRERRWRRFELDTVVGTVTVRARYGNSETQKQWICPARAAWGLESYQRLSPELQQRLCDTATEVSFYERAAAMARCGGSPVSDDRIHAHVQRQGTAAVELTLPAEKPPPTEPEFSLVIMMDGWMARERGPDWGAGEKTP